MHGHVSLLGYGVVKVQVADHFLASLRPKVTRISGFIGFLNTSWIYNKQSKIKN